MPDIIGILLDAAICRKDAGGGDVVQRDLGPKHLVLCIQIFDALLRRVIRFKVCHAHIRVGDGRAREQVVGDLGERFAVKAAQHHFDHPTDERVLVVLQAGVVSLRPHLLYFFRAQAEDEDIVLADRLAHFDVRAVQRADRNGAVHHELHVAGAARLFAGEGDLLADVRRGDHRLCHRHVVVFHVDDVELFVDLRVLFDVLGEVADQLDELLRAQVAGGRLCAEDESLRLDVLVRVVEQLGIQPVSCTRACA